jgi:peptidyl-prolyl cis-trans isomerase C
MRLQTTTITGCASSGCPCVAGACSTPSVVVNGVGLAGLQPRSDPDVLACRVVDELLRQRAVAAGLLADAGDGLAPALDDDARQVITSMLAQLLEVPAVTDDTCEAVYAANPQRYVCGQALHVRHILFAVTPEVNVHDLLVQAERALVALSRPGVGAGRFAEIAAQVSACPTGPSGGDLGWIGPGDCEPELANELFEQSHSRWGMGVHPRLIHTGRGFHIVEVLGRRKGRQMAYAEARTRIVMELICQHRRRSLEHDLRGLLAEARLQGVHVNHLNLEAPLRSWCHDG